MKVQNEPPAGSASAAQVQSPQASQLQRLNRYRSTNGAAADAHDHVELSSLAGNIVKAGESLATDHAKRVEALAKAYQNGRYTVEPHALSRKLVSSWLSPPADKDAG